MIVITADESMTVPPLKILPAAETAVATATAMPLALEQWVAPLSMADR
jgi:hypothetical protein